MVKIAHIADVHWRGLSRHGEYREVFEAFIKNVVDSRVEHVYVGGDIFHTKTSGISPEYIDQLRWWLCAMAEVACVHLTLGNHDGNLVNMSRQDAVSPIVDALKNPRINLYKKSGVYEFAPGFTWCVFSLFDEEGWKDVEPVPGKVNIASYHGPVRGATTESGWAVEDGLTVGFFERFDFCFLGDIHRMQHLATRETEVISHDAESTTKLRVQRPWIAYPGSTVQQNYAEDPDRGFLLWDIHDRTHFDVKFCMLPNPMPFVTVDWTGSVDPMTDIARQYPRGARYRVRSSVLMLQKDIVQVSERLRELGASEVVFRCDRRVNSAVVAAGSTVVEKDDLRSPDVLYRLLREFHKEQPVDEDVWSEARDHLAAYAKRAAVDDDSVRNAKWSLRHIKFDNVFNYGKGNELNIDRLGGIVGIFGPNRAGKSSIVGAMLYSLFNATDRGNLKNIHVVNVRHPYCYTRSVVDVNGTDYVIERQTTKHETKKGQVYAGTSMNLFRIANGVAEDLAGEQRADTEKVVRRMIGSADDCMLTSVAAQDDVKSFITQGTSKRRRDLSRFLDLDVLDKVHELAKLDTNANKVSPRQHPDNGWTSLGERLATEERDNDLAIKRTEERRASTTDRIEGLRSTLSGRSTCATTQSDIDAKRTKVASCKEAATKAQERLRSLTSQISDKKDRLSKVDAVLAEHDPAALKRSLDRIRSIESSLVGLRAAHQSEASELVRHERSLKILSDVPCGDSFPGCMFIKDAFSHKNGIHRQRDAVRMALEKIQTAESSLNDLRSEDVQDRLSKLEKLQALQSTLLNDITRLEASCDRADHETCVADKSLQDALKSLAAAESSIEDPTVIEARNTLSRLQNEVATLDKQRIELASRAGKIASDRARLDEDKCKRDSALRSMKAYELISQAFCRRGVPALIAASQLPVINVEIAQILGGIVDFTVELEQDVDSDSMDVFIDNGGNRRIIELASGMEKTIAAIAIRVALVNVTSLPKTDMFVIDEAFGPLDPSGVEACNRLLVSLKRYFRVIFVITHVEGLKDVADHVIEVTNDERDAKVMYDGT